MRRYRFVGTAAIVVVSDRYGRSAAAKQFGSRSPNAARSSRYENHLACKIKEILHICI